MFDFLRNLTKSAEEKRQERLNAYLDGELSARELQQFEQELAQDRELQAEVETLRQVQMSVSQLPRMKAPRNYTLDPAIYGQPVAQPSRPLYPALRLATALTAFFFVLAVALDLLTPIGALEESVAMLAAPQEAQVGEVAGEAAPPAAVLMEEAAEEEMTTAVVEEPATERTTSETPAEAPAPEIAAAEEAAEEAVEEAEDLADEATQTRETVPGIAAPEATAITSTDGAGAADAVPTGAAPDTDAEPDSAAEAADSAMNTAEAEPFEVMEAEQEEGVEAITLPTPAPESDDTALSTTTEAQQAEPFPWLLFAEVLLGVALVGLVVMTLMARRVEIGD